MSSTLPLGPFKDFVLGTAAMTSAAPTAVLPVVFNNVSRNIDIATLLSDLPSTSGTLITFSGGLPDDSVGTDGDVWWKRTAPAGVYLRENGIYNIKYSFADAALAIHFSESVPSNATGADGDLWYQTRPAGSFEGGTGNIRTDVGAQSTAVIGDGTAFLTQLEPKDEIYWIDGLHDQGGAFLGKVGASGPSSDTYLTLDRQHVNEQPVLGIWIFRKPSKVVLYKRIAGVYVLQSEVFGRDEIIPTEGRIIKLIQDRLIAQSTADTTKLATVEVASDLITEGDYATTTQLNSGLDLKENLANKVTNLATPNNTTYPTSAAVAAAINDIAAGESFQGQWNATTNTPELVSSVGTEGHYYQVSVAGATTLDGISDWALGDEVLFRNGVWTKRESFAVTSWGGKTGAVIPESADIVDFEDAVTANASVAANTAKRTYPQVDQDKLALVQANATANATNAELRARASHTGTQPASSISDFDTEVANNPQVTANTAKVSNVTHTGEVSGATDLTITPGAVTPTKLASVPTSTIRGRSAAGTGVVENLTPAQARGILNVADGAQVNPTIANDLTTNNANQVLSAAQGKALQDNKVETADFNPNPYTGFPDPATITDGQVILVRP